SSWRNLHPVRELEVDLVETVAIRLVFCTHVRLVHVLDDFTDRLLLRQRRKERQKQVPVLLAVTLDQAASLLQSFVFHVSSFLFLSVESLWVFHRPHPHAPGSARSEERRVGKEGRWRWSLEPRKEKAREQLE